MIALNITPERQPPQSGVSGIMDFPLIARHNTSSTLHSTSILGKNVYFGTGLVTSKSISQGLPFDFLGMLLTAEWVRRQIGGTSIIHEISDAHALTNPLYSAHEVTQIAKQQKKDFTDFALALGMDNSYRCILASEYRSKNVFKNVQEEIDHLSPADTPAYFRYQSAGNLYFARHEKVGCKIGWLVSDDENPTGLDERSFNYAYTQLGVQPLSFIYTWCGWNLDPRRSRVSPYTFVQGEKRIMLKVQKPAFEELVELMSSCSNEKIIRQTILHLARILTAYEVLFDHQLPKFWTDTAPGHDSSHLIEVTKPEIWTGGNYIDLKKLAAQIDKIRSMQDASFDRELITALADYTRQHRAN